MLETNDIGHLQRMVALVRTGKRALEMVKEPCFFEHALFWVYIHTRNQQIKSNQVFGKDAQMENKQQSMNLLLLEKITKLKEVVTRKELT